MRLPLLILHILAGTVGLLSGTFALAVRKGSRLHRASGNVFTIAMLTLASSALCLAIMKSQRGNIIGSIITFYMITTAWLAGRRRGIGRLDLAALLVGIGGAAAIVTLGVWDPPSPRQERPRCHVLLLGSRPPASGQVSARCDKGVLNINLAKKAEAKPTQIKVNVGGEKSLEAIAAGKAA
jgi:uncharacterized membrane protein